MKTYLGCAKKGALRQTPRSFTSGHERSVRQVQSRIFQARIQGKMIAVNALQKQLCDSFCAKLLATDYAINSVETSYVNKVQSFWRILIAKSLWSDNELSQVICDHTCFLGNKGFQEHTQPFVKLGLMKQSKRSLPKAKKGKIDQSFTCLEESVRNNKIHKTAQQIHALLALEPEWQAVFVLQRNSQGKGKVGNDSITKMSSVNTRKERIFPPNQPEQYANNCAITGTQLFRLQSKAYANRKPDFVIKQIEEHLKQAFPKYAVTASIKKWLHTMDHQILINQLNTFPEMRKRVEDLLKAGVLQSDLTALQGIKDLLKKEYTCSTTGCAKFWRTSMFRQKGKPVRLSLQAESSLFLPRYSLCSVFPKTLWKEVDRVYDLMQIENHSEVEEHVITTLLTRIVLYGLQEQVQQYADKLLLTRSKHNALCVRQRNQLCFVSLNSIKHDLANDQFTRKATKWGGSALSHPFLWKKAQNFFCSGHQDHFVMICSDKELLEVCVSQAKNYLLQITRKSSKSSVKESQRGFLKPHNKVEVREADFTDRQSRKDIDKANLFSASGLCRDFFPSSNEHKLTESLFSRVQDCRQGFTFLGFQIIQVKQRGLYVCTVTPSRESVRDLLLLITNKIKQSRSVSIDVWINRLNPLLLRWVEYYKHCEYKRSYNQISYLIWEKTRTWLARRKRKKT